MTDIDFKSGNRTPEENGRQRKFYEFAIQDAAAQRMALEIHEKLIADGFVPMGDGPLSDCYITKEEFERLNKETAHG